MQFKAEMSLVKKDGSFISEYVQRVQILSSQLTSVGCNVSEKDQIMTILNDLDREYDSIVTNVQEGHVTLQEVWHKFLSHESRLERRNMSVSSLPSVNLESVNSRANLSVVNSNASGVVNSCAPFGPSSDFMNSRNGVHMGVPYMNNGFGLKTFQSHQ